MASDNCPICLENIPNCAFQPCLHKICGDSIPRWLESKTARQCLICRQKIKSILLTDGCSISMKVLIDNSNKTDSESEESSSSSDAISLQSDDSSEEQQGRPINNIVNIMKANGAVLNEAVLNEAVLNAVEENIISQRKLNVMGFLSGFIMGMLTIYLFNKLN